MTDVDVLIDGGSKAWEPDPFAVPDAAYDFEICGMKFNAATTSDFPIERAFARVSKEMINASPQPGDASLDGWWIRSATDWSGGAGYEYMEPIDKDPIPTTYAWSYGVDVWKEGEIRLLTKPFMNVGLPVPRTGGAPPQMVVYRGYVYISSGARVWRFATSEFEKANNALTPGTEWTTIPSDVIQFSIAQGYLLVSTTKDGLGILDNTGKWSQLFTSSRGTIRAFYTKDRLILTTGNAIYEQVIKDLTSKPLDNPLYVSPEVDWTWSTVSSTPAAILIAGYGQEYSAVYSITVDNSSATPTLTPPIVAAEFPQGESVRDIRAYLGTFLLISTTSGVRVGIVSDQGVVTYGPLMDFGRVSGPFSVYDRFAFAPVVDAGEGRSGLVRLDLSKVTEDQKVPWSYDLRVSEKYGDKNGTTQVVRAEVISDGVMVIAATSWRGQFLFSVQPGCETENFGVIQSGQIRMGSTVPKAWARFSLSTTQSMRGAVRAEIVTPTGVSRIGDITNPDFEREWSFANLGLTSPHAAIRLTLARSAFPDNPVPPPPPPDPPSPEPNPNPNPNPGPEPGPGEQDWNALRTVTWQGLKDTGQRWQDISKTMVSVPEPSVTGDNPTGSPVVEGWALRGQPAIPRTELVRVGMLCFDYEMNNQGLRIGADAQAIQRYKELVRRLQPNQLVQFKDLNNKITDYVTVDELSFRQTAPPTVGSGWGGVIDLVMRVL